MVLAARGLALANTAAGSIDPAIDRFAEAAKLLKEGAGVFMVLAQVRGVKGSGRVVWGTLKRGIDDVLVDYGFLMLQDFLPRWKETSENASTRHPETSEGVAMAMIDLMTAQVIK